MSKDASLSIDLATFDPVTLPDDPALLKQLFVQERRERERQLAQRDALLAQIKAEAARQLAAQAERHAAELKAAIDALLRRYYGPRSEKFDPRQLLLFGQVVEQLPLDEASIAEEAGEQLVTRRVKKRDRHGRQPLPECLERIEIEHDLTDAEKPCPCCGEVRCRIGAEISEQLEYFPANFKVLRHVRHKYVCAKCDHAGYNPNISVAAKPAQPIDKGLPGPSLLAYVAVSKLGDHLPPTNRFAVGARGWRTSSRAHACRWPAARCAPGCARPASSSRRWWS